MRREREQGFALGVGLGMLVGVLLGSLVAVRLQPAAPGWLRRRGLFGGGSAEHVDFAALLQ